ncbi:MAG: DUF1049 domain-containing protein [Alphaproteobacteria bacterium]|nr:DUF1049 domain-containing protein [Alphaproteobacteria bacterium]NDG04790.1 DUF1049 domain-containing protein [Alphaproteobacteria bacterium]
MKWLLGLLGSLLGLVVGLACISFAVGNRGPTIVQFWPFGYEVALPIYMLALLPLLAGLLVGGLMFWLINLPKRYELFQLRGDNERQRMTINKLKEDLAEAHQAGGADTKIERWNLPVNWF